MMITKHQNPLWLAIQNNFITYLVVVKHELGKDQFTWVWIQVLYTFDTQMA